MQSYVRRVVSALAAAGVVVPMAVLAGPAAAQADVTAQVRTIEPTLVRAGSAARSVSVGDMNGDGIADLVTPNRGGRVPVILGNGGGGFDQPRSALAQPLSGELSDSVLGDFDADGDLDLAVGLTFQSKVLVLPGLGDGRLGAAVAYPLSAPLDTLARADVNGDGDDDLIATIPAADGVTVLLGGAGLTFTAAAQVAVGDSPFGVDVADVDGDGDLDLAVANGGGSTVSLRYGNGAGGFPTGREVPTRSLPVDVDVIDLQGDGLSDLVVLNRNADVEAGPGGLSVLAGSVSGGFSEVRTYVTLPSPNTVTSADIDQDGLIDFVVGSGANAPLGFGTSAPGYVSVTGGRPGSTTQIVAAKVGAAATDIEVTDLDGDDDLDVVSTRGLTYVAVLFDPLG